MTNKARKLLLLTTSVLLSCSTFGSHSSANNDVPKVINTDTQIKLEGLLHFQTGFRNQNQLNLSEKNVSGNRKGFAFYTDAAFFATVAKKMNDITYGAKLVLMPTTKVKGGSDYNGSHIFMTSEFGKIEIGSPIDSGAKMMISGYDIAAATGDDWGRYANLSCAKMQHKGIPAEFADFYGKGFLNYYKTGLGQLNTGTEPSRLISYFTPKVSGLRAGISYIPDSSNTGGSGHSKVSTATNTITVGGAGGSNINTIVSDLNVTDAFTGGVSYEHNISDGVDIKVAANGQYSRRSSNAPSVTLNYMPVGLVTPTPSVIKLSPLKSYNIGGILSYGNMSYNLAYGSFGKSLTSSEYHKTGRNTSYYGGAVAYGQGPMKSSISFFKSSQYTNTLNFISVGTEYNIMPGLMPYAEISYFQGKGKPSFYNKEGSKQKIKGTIALIGAKLKL